MQTTPVTSTIRQRTASARKWRILGALALVAGLAAAAAGVAYGVLADGGQGTGFASTGELVLTVNTSATQTCSYGALSPGDLTGTKTCALSVNYSGTTSAYISLGVLIETQAGRGGRGLFAPGYTNGLTMTVSSASPSVSYAMPTVATTCPTSAPTHSTCYQLNYELAGTSPFSSPSTLTFTLTPKFLAIDGNKDQNSYQGGSAQVLLTAYAVQSPGNTLSCTTTPTAGQPCTPSGSFSWS